MIYLIFGPDTYRIKKEIKELTKKSEADLYILDIEEDGFSKIRLLAGSGSLFSRKKLLIVEKANMIQSRELSDFISNFQNHEDTIVFWDEKVDAEKLQILKSLNPALAGKDGASIKIQEFKNLIGVQLKNWIAEEAKQRGLRLFPAHWERLENFGSDLWAVSNEMDKMLVEGDSSQKPDEFKETNIFGLGDNLFVSKKQGLNDLLQLSQQGEDEFGLFSYLTNYCRTILIVKYYAEKKQSVATAHKIHPFVVKKATAMSKGLSFDRLTDKFRNFFEEDSKIKTGLSKPMESLEKILLG